MPTLSNARALAVLAATGALLLAAFAAAPQAEASTLYACVKKGGTVKVFTKAPKCKKHETKISWNSVGPAGKNGTNGTNGTSGTNGTNGAVAGYSASKSSAVNIIGGTIEAPVTILTKTIPAGSYIVFAKSIIAAGDSANGAKWTAQCDLTDKPVSGASTVDTSTASGEVVTNFLFHTGFATLPLGIAVTTTTESTLTLGCTEVWNTSSTGKFEMSATNSVITALQTSHNG